MKTKFIPTPQKHQILPIGLPDGDDMALDEELIAFNHLDMLVRYDEGFVYLHKGILGQKAQDVRQGFSHLNLGIAGGDQDVLSAALKLSFYPNSLKVFYQLPKW